MSEKCLGLFRNESLRLKTHDYGTSCSYFITISTHNMKRYFGDVVPARTGYNPSIQLTEIGITARDCWTQIPQHYSFVEVGPFVIMPNHVHGILHFKVPYKETWAPNKFGPQKNNLAVVIGTYKAAVSRYANRNGVDFRWKSRYHETIIWTLEDLNNINNYIYNNPIEWIKNIK